MMIKDFFDYDDYYYGNTITRIKNTLSIEHEFSKEDLLKLALMKPYNYELISRNDCPMYVLEAQKYNDDHYAKICVLMSEKVTCDLIKIFVKDDVAQVAFLALRRAVELGMFYEIQEELINAPLWHDQIHRVYIASLPFIESSLIEKLANDEKAIVRRSVASNRSCPNEILMMLIWDCDADVSKTALKELNKRQK